MQTIAKVGAVAATAALVGGFFVGRVMAEPAPLPTVRAPLTDGATAESTPSAEPPTLRPRANRTGPGRARPTSDNSGPGNAESRGRDNSGPGNAEDRGDDNSGRGRGRGRGGDDDVRTVGPSPSVVSPDDHGGNSGPGGGGSGNSGPGGGGSGSGGGGDDGHDDD